MRKPLRRRKRNIRRTLSPFFRPFLEVLEDRRVLAGNVRPEWVLDTVSAEGEAPAANQVPTLVHNTGITALEGQTLTISNAQLLATDPDNTAAELTYTLTSLPANGLLKKSGGTLANGGTFTQQDIADGRIQYVHNGGETLSDGFGFSLSDGSGASSVSRASVDSGEIEGDGHSYEATISANGRYVAFRSVASNLVNGDTNNADDIFVRDLTAGTTTRISVNSDGIEGNFGSAEASVSADGRYVAFSSVADNLVAEDTNQQTDVFLRDMVMGTTTRLSVDTNGAEGNGSSYRAKISADGRYVTFYSYASNLVPGDTNGKTDIFVRDIFAETTTRISVDTTGNQSNGHSFDPAISEDGRYVAFRSSGTNLAAMDANGVEDIFVRDRVAGTTTLVSVSSNGNQANEFSSSAAISGDGRYVAFTSYANNLVDGDTNNIFDVFVRDLVDGTTIRVSVDSAGFEGDDSSTSPSLSADGRFVTFMSSASNLVPGDTNGSSDVFLRDLLFGTTKRISVDNHGNQGEGDSRFPVISADGRRVAFYSSDSMLVSGDSNGALDAFVYDAGAVHSNVAITITPLNDPPTLVNNTGLSILEGQTLTISNTQLLATDPDNTAAELTYTLTSLPANGWLKKDGSALAINETFTQQDIEDGKIQYVHDGGATLSDGYGFSLSDGASASATTRISVNSSGLQANSVSYEPSSSADGRYVAFRSLASNLVAGDTNSKYDIFVRDRVFGTTTRVSVDSSEVQANGDSYDPAISPDGRFVAFQSSASNLVAGDTNGVDDIFIRDLVLGTTTRVSLHSSGSQGNGSSLEPSISADGRYVAFHSNANNLVTGDTNSVADVFVRDTVNGITTRVSVTTSGVQATGASEFASISADGLFVAFHSNAANLVTGDTNSVSDIFVYALQTGVTTRASLNSSGVQGNSSSFRPVLSADGRYVAFSSYSSNLSVGDTNGLSDIFVRDLSSGVTTRVSVHTNGTQGNDNSTDPAISADGRYVAFAAFASTLVDDDTNGTGDIFLRDTQTGKTKRVSVDSNGVQGNGQSLELSLSSDGRSVAVMSSSSNLVVGDTNSTFDIFSHDAGILRATVAITVTPVNDPPVVSDIADRIIAENSSTGPMEFFVDDLDLEDASNDGQITALDHLILVNGITLSGSSSNTTLVPNSNITFGGVGTNRTVTVTPAPNQSGTAMITVKVTDIHGAFTNETFVLNVLADPEVSLSVSPTSVLEDGAAKMVYSFTRTGDVDSPLTVNFSIAGGASFSSDYSQSGAASFTANVGTVTFDVGSALAQVTIDPLMDSAVEPNETVVLSLATGNGYKLGATSSATGTIIDDDVVAVAVSVAVSPASVTEDGPANLIYTFTRSGGIASSLTVNYVMSGSATVGLDYLGTASSVTFASGSSTATVTVNPSADIVVELDETVTLTLGAGSGYTVDSPSVATGTIVNDDTTVSVAVSPSTVTEDGAANLIFTFTRPGTTGLTPALTVNYSVSGAANSANDFSGTTGSVTFAAGSSTATVTVDPTSDSVLEGDETIVLTVAPGSGYSSGNPSVATGTIVNDDFLSISGRAYVDLDGDGTDDSATDPGKSGVTIYLDQDDSGTFTTGDLFTTTASDGSYTFNSLGSRVSGYVVREVPPSGWQQTAPAGLSYNVSAVNAASIPGRDFGNFQLFSISGRVFTDLDGNGTDNSGSDPNLAGVTVYLDLDNSSTQNSGDVVATTTVNGTYSFSNLGPRAGGYVVRIVTPTGGTQTAPAGDSHTVTATSGQNVTGLNLGVAFPEIQVFGPAGELFDNVTVVDFGAVLIGTSGPVTQKSFMVKNIGGTTLTLGSITAPNGFSVAQNLSSNTLAPGATATFVLSIDTSLPGAKTGVLSFGNNDLNENTFDVPLTGVITTSQIIDNGNPGFAATSGFGVFNNQGFASTDNVTDVHSAPAFGTPNVVAENATWTFAGLGNSAYRVLVTWTDLGNRATNSPFTIFDGTPATGVSRGTTLVNQQVAPIGYTDPQQPLVKWQELGSFDVTSGTLTVQLTNSANLYVIADAVRIEPVVGPEIEMRSGGALVVDNSGILDFGTTPQFFPTNKTLTVRNQGSSTLTVEAPSLPAGFILVSPPTFPLSLAPRGLAGDSIDLQVRFTATAAGIVTGPVSFVTNDTDENPFNFTLKGNTGSQTAFVDDGDADYSNSSNFLLANQGFQGDVRYASPGNASQKATWTFNLASLGLPTTGAYRVAATWTGTAGRATNAQFTVKDSSAAFPTAIVNQVSNPSGVADKGAVWQRLGEYYITSGVITVDLSAVANGYVIADGIRIERVVTPEANVSTNGLAVNSGATTDFGSSMNSSPNVVKTFTVTNGGESALDLANLNIPSGFLLAQTFGATSLAPGASTTFQVAMNGTTVGTKSGTLTFTTNDSSNATMSFPLTGMVTAPVTIIDDGATGYSDNGLAPYGGQGYQNDVHYAAQNTGKTATWSFTNLPAGTYSVAVSYTPGGRATNTPFTIVGVGTTTVNQNLTPNDIVDQGIGWKLLSNVVTVTGAGTLTVTMSSNGANGYVIADAVRVERLSALYAADSEEVAVRTPEASTVSLLTNETAQAFVANAAKRWSAVNTAAADALSDVRVVVASLPENVLGLSSPTTHMIWLSNNAAGQGWFVDRTPQFDEEFTRAGGSHIALGIDLLTVATHELGHVLGLADLDDHLELSTMTETLAAGTRRLPTIELPVDGTVNVGMPKFITAAPLVTLHKGSGSLLENGFAGGLQRTIAADELFTQWGLEQFPRTSMETSGAAKKATSPKVMIAKRGLNSLEGKPKLSEKPSDEGAHLQLFAELGQEEKLTEE